MMILSYKCDGCGNVVEKRPYVALDFKEAPPKSGGGILLPRHEYHLCSKECLETFVKTLIGK